MDIIFKEDRKEIPIKEGNIVLTDKDIIIQQVNCQGAMGAGLSGTIAKRYPEVLKAYKKLHKQATKDSPNELLLGYVQFVDTYDGKVVANIFGQVHYGNDGKLYTDEEALLEGVEQVERLASKHKLSVAIPTYLGCGLAGGDWNVIKRGIDTIFSGSKVDVEYYHYR